jgi:hypothetical protein
MVIYLVPRLRLGMHSERLRLVSREAHEEAFPMGRSRYRLVENGKSYCLTSSTLHWLPLFEVPALSDMVIDSLNLEGGAFRTAFPGGARERGGKAEFARGYWRRFPHCREHACKKTSNY